MIPVHELHIRRNASHLLKQAIFLLRHISQIQDTLLGKKVAVIFTDIVLSDYWDMAYSDGTEISEKLG